MLKGSIAISIPIYGSNIFYDTFLWFMNWFGFDFGFLPYNLYLFCSFGKAAFESWESLASKRLPKHIGAIIRITFGGARS